MGTMMDPETALSAINAAGDDFQSLYEAIKKAEFLNATPGDYRQQLRGRFLSTEKERKKKKKTLFSPSRHYCLVRVQCASDGRRRFLSLRHH